MPKELDQAARRETAFPRDQHGRKWEAQYDIIARAPCSPLVPSGWSAPWLPADKYLVTDPTDNRALLIDYDRCIADHRTALREYDRAIKTQARTYGVAGASMLEAQTLPDGRKIPHALILDEVGPPPLSDTFARAARAGNRWVLGQLTPTGQRYAVPPWAEPFLFELDDQSTETFDDADAFADAETFADVATAGGASEFPDVAEAPPAPLDRFADLEEQHDPDALGGHRIPVRVARRQAAAGKA